MISELYWNRQMSKANNTIRAIRDITLSFFPDNIVNKPNTSQFLSVSSAIESFLKKTITYSQLYNIVLQTTGIVQPIERLKSILQTCPEPIPEPDDDEIGKSKYRRKSRPWTTYEDQRLICAIYHNGIENWTQISKFVGNGRTRSQCSQRWYRGLNPKINKNQWTKEEESRLIDVVQQYGDKSWTKIASKMGNRSDVQCRYRFKQLIREMERKGIAIEIGIGEPDEGESEYEASDDPQANLNNSRRNISILNSNKNQIARKFIEKLNMAPNRPSNINYTTNVNGNDPNECLNKMTMVKHNGKIFNGNLAVNGPNINSNVPIYSNASNVIPIRSPQIVYCPAPQSQIPQQAPQQITQQAPQQQVMQVVQFPSQQPVVLLAGQPGNSIGPITPQTPTTSFSPSQAPVSIPIQIQIDAPQIPIQQIPPTIQQTITQAVPQPLPSQPLQPQPLPSQQLQPPLLQSQPASLPPQPIHQLSPPALSQVQLPIQSQINMQPQLQFSPPIHPNGAPQQILTAPQSSPMPAHFPQNFIYNSATQPAPSPANINTLIPIDRTSSQKVIRSNHQRKEENQAVQSPFSLFPQHIVQSPALVFGVPSPMPIASPALKVAPVQDHPGGEVFPLELGQQKVHTITAPAFDGKMYSVY
ncbi:hypothetical protein TRFO_35139 [Tritrichomonas foetus]|uniref:Myb-like DNA-binding domain containing protein n=1 Tax=Tritrichomonas foetus TaxID=1144522 RepID=A0A1J4JIE8_9EUKA|nr:hypothetical protein TRFO_35139 [Tritrichomonas foetus]|eukprot:OHS98465.1 hypothetical protein TRFO_35139 [Tritrichomonas foetus]